MAHPEGGALGRLRSVNSGGRHNDFFGGRQYDRRGRHGNFGGALPKLIRAALRLQKVTMTSEGGTMTSEGDT